MSPNDKGSTEIVTSGDRILLSVCSGGEVAEYPEVAPHVGVGLICDFAQEIPLWARSVGSGKVAKSRGREMQIHEDLVLIHRIYGICAEVSPPGRWISPTFSEAPDQA
ncbi:hypothetical protein MRB53_040952 [Persea americana]|nr:hypothetical protein MRB53_040952 [Persea americana]